ncbi:UDP-N-acetylglucosamine 4,6-dehydratase family protein [Porphyromonas macacae]|uniref:UDP-N-acetylglucosamine 4,6-dehydratase family protein n=1 Tax=Porphyromonas macacae TaxID=28115 RepID=UPI0006914C84|nr:nucleoside-diphosphate sugar epimerase/dehydratase [Porphyromonas macacae]
MDKKDTTKNKRCFVSLIKRLYDLPFINKWLIFVMDVLFAFVASFIVLPKSVRDGLLNKYDGIWPLLICLVISILIVLIFATHKRIIRHSTFTEVNRVTIAMFAKSLLFYLVLLFLIPDFKRYYFVAFLLDWILSSFFLITVRSFMVNLYHRVIRPHAKSKKTWIYGIGPRSANLTNFLASGLMPPFLPTLVVTRDKSNKGLRLNGLPIVMIKDRSDIKSLIETYGSPDVILFPDSTSVHQEKNSLLEFFMNNGIELMMAPDYETLADPKQAKRRIREIRIEDLLGRPVIDMPMDNVRKELEGKTVLITGAAGSIGSEIVRQVSRMNVKQLVLFDNAESPLHNIRLEIEKRYPGLLLSPIIGDVRSEERLRYVFERFHPQYIFHAAAYKHVPLMEENPCEAVGVNVKGTNFLTRLAVEYGVDKFVMVSTDKAVNPTNVMGATKRVAEVIVQNIDTEIKTGKLKGITQFITTRFGNVLGSNGSVIPLFRQQIEQGGPVTVTHPDIIRFFMTIPEACSLVLEAGTMGQGGEIFAFDMGEPMRIDDLARNMIKLSGFKPDVDIKVEYTGLRPGEKLFEEVLDDKETTLPTTHPKIRVGKVREVNSEKIVMQVKEMIRLSEEIRPMETVAAIKALLPEYTSKNSPYEVLDKK